MAAELSDDDCPEPELSDTSSDRGDDCPELSDTSSDCGDCDLEQDDPLSIDDGDDDALPAGGNTGSDDPKLSLLIRLLDSTQAEAEKAVADIRSEIREITDELDELEKQLPLLSADLMAHPRGRILLLLLSLLINIISEVTVRVINETSSPPAGRSRRRTQLQVVLNRRSWEEYRTEKIATRLFEKLFAAERRALFRLIQVRWKLIHT